MKMKVIKAVEGYQALKRIGKNAFPYKTAKAMYDMRKLLENQFEFYQEQEKTLIEKYGGKPGEDGAVSFPDILHKLGFLKERQEMDQSEIDLEITPVNVREDSLIEISPDDIEVLEGLVTIGKEG